MKSKKLLGIGLLALSLGLVSCAPRALVMTPALGDDPSHAVAQESFVPRPGHSIVSFTIRWPNDYTAQAIPSDTQKLVITLKAGNEVIGSKSIDRSPGQAKETVKFDLDPKHGTITAEVKALSGNNSELASGTTSLRLRDNSLVQASITLSVTDQIYLSNQSALAFLHNPIDSLSNWATYPSNEVVNAAMQGAFKLASGLPQLRAVNLRPAPASSNLGPSQEVLGLPQEKATIELSDSMLKALSWPGYNAVITDKTTTKGRAFEVQAKKGGTIPAGDGGIDDTELHLGFEVDASAWRDEAGLLVQGDFLQDANPITRTLKLFGGQVPADNAVERVKATLELKPHGYLDQPLHLSVEGREFVDLAQMAYFRTFMPGGAFWSSVPTLFKTSFAIPHLRTKADSGLNLKVFPDLTGGYLKGDLQVQLYDNNDKPHEIYLDLGLELTPESPQNPIPKAFKLSFTVIDRTMNLRAIGSYEIANLWQPSNQALKAWFYNHVTNDLIGEIDYVPQPGADMTRLAHWPTLKLHENPDNRQEVTAQIPLTPGYFIGDKNPDGSLNVRVY